MANRAYSFFLMMPPNADFDLYLICVNTLEILAHNVIFFPGQTEQFQLVFPSWVQHEDIGILIHAYSGSGTYTAFAGPLWQGKTLDGNVFSARHFDRNLTWRHNFGSVPAQQPPFHNQRTFSPIFTLDLRNDASVPVNALMINPILRSSHTGDANNFMTHMIFPNGQSEDTMFDAIPIPNPSFRSGNTSFPTPTGVNVRQEWRFRFSITSTHPVPGGTTFFNWQATSISFGMIFPATPANRWFL